MKMESKIIRLNGRTIVFNNVSNRLRRPIKESHKKYSSYEVARFTPLINLIIDIASGNKAEKDLLEYCRRNKIESGTMQKIVQTVNLALQDYKKL
jgi:hypothetical protein